MILYLKRHIWEWLLCSVAAATILVNFSQGFYVPDSVADSFLLALLVCAVVTFLCMLSGYSRAGMFIFPACVIVVLVLMFLWMRYNGIDVVDEEGSDTSVYIYYFAALIIPTAAWFLTRTRVGVCVLFVVGAILFAAMDYLDYDIEYWWCVVFALCVPVIFALRLYRKRSLEGSTLAPQFFRLFLTALAVGVLTVALSIGVYAAVIRPLEPPTITFNLIMKYMKWDILQKTGIANLYVFPDDMIIAFDPEHLTTSSQKKEQEEEETEEESENSEEDTDDMSENTALGELEGGGGFSDLLYKAIRYLSKLLDYIGFIIALVIILIVLIPFIKHWTWKKKIKDSLSLSPRERAVTLFKYYTSRFKRLGYGRARSQTELEYADSYANTLGNFTTGTLSLGELTNIYLKARYGGIAPTEEEDKNIVEFYPAFRRNYRQGKGWFNFVLKYFRF